jgi:hypothetical protein
MSIPTEIADAHTLQEGLSRLSSLSLETRPCLISTKCLLTATYNHKIAFASAFYFESGLVSEKHKSIALSSNLSPNRSSDYYLGILDPTSPVVEGSLHNLPYSIRRLVEGVNRLPTRVEPHRRG